MNLYHYLLPFLLGGLCCSGEVAARKRKKIPTSQRVHTDAVDKKLQKREETAEQAALVGATLLGIAFTIYAFNNNYFKGLFEKPEGGSGSGRSGEFEMSLDEKENEKKDGRFSDDEEAKIFKKNFKNNKSRKIISTSTRKSSGTIIIDRNSDQSSDEDRVHLFKTENYKRDHLYNGPDYKKKEEIFEEKKIEDEFFEEKEIISEEVQF